MTDARTTSYYKYIEYKNRYRPYKNQRINYILTNFDSWFFKKFPLKNKKILDFGCSINSRMYERFIRENGNDSGYFGFDIEESVISWLKEKNYFLDTSAITKKELFDYIFLVDIYEHLELYERIEMLKAAHKLLKFGGLVVVAYPYMKNLNFFINGISDPTHKLTDFEGEVANFIEYGGFEQEKVNLFLGGWTTPAISLLKNLMAIFRNLLCLFPPFHVAVITAEKQQNHT